MFDFGVAGYQPQWLSGLAAVRAAHGRRLGELAGRTLQRVWLVWDLDADEWFADCPVFLDFDGEQIEVNHWKFGELSISWNTGDTTQPVSWLGADDLRLAWRADATPELAGLRGQVLRAVELLEWHTADTTDLANGTVAVRFVLERGELTVHNALDENGLDLRPPGTGWRRHPLG